MPKRDKRKNTPLCIPMTGCFRIEIKRGKGRHKEITISDCQEILTYSHEEISFRYQREVIVVKGENLWCRTYGCRVAEVVGEVDSVSFEGGKT